MDDIQDKASKERTQQTKQIMQGKNSLHFYGPTRPNDLLKQNLKYKTTRSRYQHGIPKILLNLFTLSNQQTI
jgi:hypothetical protein